MPTILITGARQGLGLELARRCAEGGWCILATCLAPDTAKELQDLAARFPDRFTVHRLDVTDHAEVDALGVELRGTAIDVLYNNAGIKGPDEQDFDGIDYAAWRDVLETNLLAPMKMAEVFADHVAASERKQIVTMASGTGSLAWNQPGRPGPEGGGLIYYRTSKAGVNMITRNLAIELKSRGITVVALAPGHVRTEMGGPEAPLSIEDSVTGIMRLLDELTPAHSGSFLLYDGSTYAW